MRDGQVRPRAGRHPLRRHGALARTTRSPAPRKHGDGVRDIALTVPDATRRTRGRLARRAQRLRADTTEDEFGKVERSAIATYGDTIHTFVNRSDYAGPFLPGYVSLSENGHRDAGVGLIAIDHVVGNVELGRMDTGSSSTSECSG